MKVPFQLHRRLPQIRRLLEQRDVIMRENGVLREEIKLLRNRNEVLEHALSGHTATASPLLCGVSSADMGRTAQRIWSLLRPMDVAGKQLVRKGRDNDGGYIMLDHGLRNAVVYSLGINNDVSWDLEMAALDCEVYQYDHTIDALPAPHVRFHWFRTGIAAQESADGTLRPLPDLIRQNGHAGRSDLILKMDIEGFEWEALEAMPEDVLAQFSQIVMEVHLLALGGEQLQSRIALVFEKLHVLFQPVHVHANNHGYVGLIGGVMVPDAMELTYVRRADHRFEPCDRIFPGELDMPCRPDVPDIFLGPLGALPPFNGQPARPAACLDGGTVTVGST